MGQFSRAAKILAAGGIFLVGARAVETRERAGIYWAAWIAALVLIPGFYSDLAASSFQAWSRAIHLKTIGYFYVATVVVVLFFIDGPAGTRDVNGAASA